MWILTQAVHKLRGLRSRIWDRRWGIGRRTAEPIWSRDYAQGKWDFMRSPEEGERYRRLAALCLHSKTMPTVLDVGSGEGILLEYLCQMNYEPSGYLGIDLSTEAIRRARLQHPAAHFEVADAEQYQPAQRFDVIVMNECLYYFPRPVKVLQSLESGLATAGVFVVSVHEPPHHPKRHVRFWQTVCEHYDCLEHQTVTNRQGIRWDLGVFHPSQMEVQNAYDR